MPISYEGMLEVKNDTSGLWAVCDINLLFFVKKKYTLEIW